MENNANNLNNDNDVERELTDESADNVINEPVNESTDDVINEPTNEPTDDVEHELADEPADADNVINKPIKKAPHKTKIGGQALFEGVMMRGSGKEAMAVRKKDGSIFTEVKDVPANKWYQKTLFVRGVFNFILQMKNGYSYLMKSFDVSGFLEEEEEEKNEQLTIDEELTVDELAMPVIDPEDEQLTVDNGQLTVVKAKMQKKVKAKKAKKEDDGKALEGFLGVIGMVAGVAFGMFLFMFVPTHTFTFISGFINADISGLQSLSEGVVRIILFVLYMWAVSLMKEIRVTYEYHGAEHKTIAAYEAGEELDPENVENLKKYTRFHPRCGTSFIFLVLAFSILIYSILPIKSETLSEYFRLSLFFANLLRITIQILLTPFIVAFTYEIIKLAGRYDRNIFMRILSAPGLGLQRLTVFEPNEKQLQVAVSAMLPVIPENKEEDVW
ncbi:MAG: DUF1385 domain-containing protein [Oscillospiraceae bacterium]|nr:DUF1385 domain-containing protein [Oscillospiraceae bacterium]